MCGIVFTIAKSGCDDDSGVFTPKNLFELWSSIDCDVPILDRFDDSKIVGHASLPEVTHHDGCYEMTMICEFDDGVDITGMHVCPGFTSDAAEASVLDGARYHGVKLLTLGLCEK